MLCVNFTNCFSCLDFSSMHMCYLAPSVVTNNRTSFKNIRSNFFTCLLQSTLNTTIHRYFSFQPHHVSLSYGVWQLYIFSQGYSGLEPSLDFLLAIFCFPVSYILQQLLLVAVGFLKLF